MRMSREDNENEGLEIITIVRRVERLDMDRELGLVYLYILI
jgi:hypothetical protein